MRAQLKPMTPAQFKKMAEIARAKNPKCQGCGRDLSAVPLLELTYLRRAKRIACRNCPKMIVLDFKTPAAAPSLTPHSDTSG